MKKDKKSELNVLRLYSLDSDLISSKCDSNGS